MTVFVFVNTSKPSGDPDHIKVFANVDAANSPAWGNPLVRAPRLRFVVASDCSESPPRSPVPTLCENLGQAVHGHHG
jgi:hypothetical protein